MLLASKLGALTCLWYTAFRSKLFCFPESPFLSCKHKKQPWEWGKGIHKASRALPNLKRICFAISYEKIFQRKLMGAPLNLCSAS